MPARTIDEVIERLDGIVDRAKTTGETLGVFAALYAAVTHHVKRRIDAGFFEDGERMGRLDTAFANRYFDAYESFRSGGRPRRSWRVAFDAGSRSDLIVLQHLLLGMNAHINFDLGIATADLFSPGELPGVRSDFEKINVVLAELLDRAQATIARFSPLLGILDDIGGRTDEHVANFSIDRAREDAWNHALILVRLKTDARNLTMDVMDRKVAFLGRVLSSPDPVVAAGITVIRMTESRDMAAIIEAIHGLA